MFKILIVEDDKELNKTVCSFLNHSGYEATGCLNASDAYDALYEDMFDLIVSDIMMPGVDGSRRMADMMTNILKLSRLENQQFYPQVSEYDLGEQLCECLLQYENVWEKANIEIKTDIAEDVTVKADAELLGHVWNNLFSNAFKFTPAGGMVTVSLTATEHYAVVKVTDTGCGMTPDVGAHIFEKFYQGDTSHSVQGNGLGLALVKKVIDIMQGEIGVESTVGKGSTFIVKIRRA